MTEPMVSATWEELHPITHVEKSRETISNFSTKFDAIEKGHFLRRPSWSDCRDRTLDSRGMTVVGAFLGRLITACLINIGWLGQILGWYGLRSEESRSIAFKLSFFRHIRGPLMWA